MKEEFEYYNWLPIEKRFGTFVIVPPPTEEEYKIIYERIKTKNEQFADIPGAAGQGRAWLGVAGQGKARRGQGKAGLGGTNEDINKLGIVKLIYSDPKVRENYIKKTMPYMLIEKK